MLQRLADYLVLCPSRHAIATEQKRRIAVPWKDAHVEVWAEQTHAHLGREPRLFVFKLPGTGGRAERATTHPADIWPDLPIAVWTLNPPGYGGSSGRASLLHLESAALAAFDALERIAAGRPIIVSGNSLGAATALRVAATRAVQGLLLRNPPPLRELIRGRFGWWNFGLAAELVAARVPRELDALENAARVTAPSVIVSARRDRVVPPPYQQRVIAALGGAKRVVSLARADHADPPSPAEAVQYAAELRWLMELSLDAALSG